MAISQGGQLGPSMVVGACEAATFDYPIDGPFTVGFALASRFAPEPMPALVESSDLHLTDGRYRLLIRIAPGVLSPSENSTAR